MNRREFLEILAGGAASAAFPSPLRAGSRKPKRPNIVLIMADDMGFSDIGCYGGEIHTPNLDRLAAGGLRFSQFYNTARCCPTRASLITGLYPHQAGVGHMIDDLKHPGYMGRLSERCVTFAEVLKEAGYSTLMSGKWHVGENRPYWPVDRGFDEYFGLISGGSSYWSLPARRKMARNDEPYFPPKEGFYMTDAFTDHALEFVEKYGGKEKPFFLYLAYTAPHWPLHAYREDIEKYRRRYDCGWDVIRRERRKRMIRMGLLKPSWPLTPRDRRVLPWKKVGAERRARMALKMAVYAAQVDRMDRNIGRLLKKLEGMGILENTLILFLSDNGGCAEGGTWGFDRKKGKLGTDESFSSYGLSWANASNTPFRLYKHWVHEGGISTPLIAHWPAVIGKGGGITSQVGHLVDIMATLVDVAHARYPGTYKGRKILPLQGKSLLPVFQGKEREGHDALFWEHEGNKAVRKGKWKLVSRYPGRWELYDMEADRTELHDLSRKEPKKAAELAALYRDWAEKDLVVPWRKLMEERRKRRRRKKKGPKR